MIYNYPVIPSNLKPPFRFREPGGHFEGSLDNPWEIVERFEPVDVLNGACQIVDSQGVVLNIMSNDTSMIEDNEYKNKGALYLIVIE